MNLNTSFAKYRKRPNSGRRSSPILSSLSPPNSHEDTPNNDQVAQQNNEIKTKSKNKKFSVLFRKMTTKKNKTWEGDGNLSLNEYTNFALIYDEDGMIIGRIKDADKVIYRDEFKYGGYEFQLNDEIVSSKVPKLTLSSTPQQVVNSIATKFKSPLLNNRSNMTNLKPQTVQEPLNVYGQKEPVISSKQIKSTISPNIGNLRRKKILSNAPLYDVSKIDNPLFMPDLPKSIDVTEISRKVVVEPSLSSKLRPHQRDGIKFLYSCLMGINNSDMKGAILADEMGLGKTLQTIALIWTLLRQSPIIDSKPVVNKVLICCPVSLVNNWKNEFSKWLGMNRVGVLTINNNRGHDEIQDIELFGRNNVHQILIIGYEKMQSMSNYLVSVKFDLLVCDEGHRLKNSENKAMKTLESFQIRRRILLTGTPIQNDLVEFFTMANFANPGILGDLKSFQRDFIKPILDSRDSNCRSDLSIKKGKKKSKELVELTNSFILRRSNAELTKYLPKRSDFFIFVPPTALQLQLFRTVIETKRFQNFINEDTGNGQSSLNLINTFRKICNSPSLLKEDGFFLEICERNSNSSDDIEFRNQLGKKVKSGKIIVLIKILGLLHSKNEEKVVIVSNFTSTLNIIESILKSLNLTFLRLDGSTKANERSKIVEKFNKSTVDDNFILLLSAKAGGVGLNLIGGSRLILFDNDWNPAIDLQAVARVHRDGQKREVKIYRFITNGCMDEKILQRQLVKQDLSDKFIDQKGGEKELFNREDIKDIFTLQFDKIKSNQYCNTHEIMNCDCLGDGSVMINGKFYDDELEEEVEDMNELEIDEEKKQFMSALDFTQKFPDELKEDNEDILRRKKIRRCMKGYRHINGLNGNIVETNDEVLNSLVNNQDKEKPLVSFIFGKY